MTLPKECPLELTEAMAAYVRARWGGPRLMAYEIVNYDGREFASMSAEGGPKSSADFESNDIPTLVELIKRATEELDR